jgi:hypothetical protein
MTLGRTLHAMLTRGGAALTDGLMESVSDLPVDGSHNAQALVIRDCLE